MVDITYTSLTRSIENGVPSTSSGMSGTAAVPENLWLELLSDVALKSAAFKHFSC